MANDQKIENLLNLALDATDSERERSMVLDVGFNPADRRWTVIVKYTGNLEELQSEEIQIIELYNEYAIVNLPESLLEAFASQPQIEYMEKTKRLFFAVNQGRTASCMSALQNAQYNLFGQDVIVAVIDSGVDYRHPDFCNADGSTRILEIWDQSAAGEPSPEYGMGTVYTREQINEALAVSREEGYRIVPERDLSGHGTEVLGIAAGNGRASDGRYRGVASQSDILVVKLGIAQADGFPRTTELMMAVDYVVKRAVFYQKPVAINLSFGTVYGGHDGTALLETYLDDMANLWRSVIVVGTGNEGAAAGHTSGVLRAGEVTEVELGIAVQEPTVNLQLWKSYVDQFDVVLIDPSGRELGPLQELLGPQRFLTPGTELLVYYGEPNPYSPSQEIYVDFLPRGSYIDSGIWRIRLIPRRIVDGRFNMWLPSATVLNTGTRFYRPSAETTLTIPSTARKVISVGAYDSRTMTYAPFSGRGFDRLNEQVKPDIAAPGVGINTAAVGGGYTVVSGTSFATPFVTGAAAMMMQWGIVDGNDPYLYGEKVKAYLRRGARQLPGFTVYPNPQVGYGALCVRDSLSR